MRQFVTFLMMFVGLAVFAQERVHVGDIYCTDNTTVSPEDFATSGKTALGVVFFVDNSQQHGWALALNDAGSGTVTWGNTESLCYLNSYNNNPQLVNADTIGSARCDSIVHAAQILGWTLAEYSSAVNAAMQCGTGWYLPSMGQLAVLYGNMTEINAALDVIDNSSKMNGRQYWSCTEENYGVVSAWVLNYNGEALATPKGTAANVRAIRNF